MFTWSAGNARFESAASATSRLVSFTDISSASGGASTRPAMINLMSVELS